MTHRKYKLSGRTRKLYDTCIKTGKFINLELEFDIEPKDKDCVLHMIEGGSMRYKGDYFILPNYEKINAIFQEFGDKSTNVIMYRFPSELGKLRSKFRHTKLLPLSTKYNLSHFNNLIIYSYYPTETRDLPAMPTFVYVAENTIGEEWIDVR